MENDRIRDLMVLAIPRVGRVDPTGDVALPYRLLDADGVEVACVSDFLRDMLSNDASTRSLRSYCYELLAWFRFLWAVVVLWDRAGSAEARDFALWLKVIAKPSRARRIESPPPGAVNAVTGQRYPGAGYAARTRRQRPPQPDAVVASAAAPGAVPAPIRDAECDQRKQIASHKARIDQRTRTLLPALPESTRSPDTTATPSPCSTPPGRYYPRRSSLRRDDVRDGVVACAARTSAASMSTVDARTTSPSRKQTHSGPGHWSKSCGTPAAEPSPPACWNGMRIEEVLELTHHSFVAYTLPTTGEVVPMLQVAPSKIDAERLLLVSPELGEVLTAIIHRVRGANAAIALVSAYDELELVWSPPMPFLFQRTFNTEHRHMPRAYVSACLNRAVAASGLTDAANAPLSFTPHDFRRLFVTDAIRSGLSPHIAAAICGYQLLDTTMGYAATYPEDVINHHRAFIARRRAQRPSEEYRDLRPEEWDEFLGHFELRKVALGVCTRDYGTPCIHEHACVRCPQLRPDPAQMPRLKEICANLLDRMQEANEHGWLGEVAAIEASLAAADRKLEAMSAIAARHTVTHLGMPDFRAATGRSTSKT